MLRQDDISEWHLANHAGMMQEAVVLEARRDVDQQFRRAKRCQEV